MNSRYLNRVKRRDRWARWVIISGGIGIIMSMMVMIVFMIKVTLPLFTEPTRELVRRIEPTGLEKAVIYDLDPYMEKGFIIDESGLVSVFQLQETGRVVSTHQLTAPRESAVTPSEESSTGPEASSTEDSTETGAASAEETQESTGPKVLRAEKVGKHFYVVYWSNGAATYLMNEFKVTFDEQSRRQIKSHVEEIASIPAGLLGEGTALSSFRVNEEGGGTFVRLLSEGDLLLYRVDRTEDFFGEVTEEVSESRLTIRGDSPVTAISLTQDGQWLFLGTASGTLQCYQLSSIEEPKFIDLVQATFEGAPVTAMNFPFGESSVVVGDRRGHLNFWSLIRYKGGPKLKRIHEFDSHNAAITGIAPSLKDKAILSRDELGHLNITHMTSERHLMTLDAELAFEDFALSERFDGILLRDTNNVFWLWGLNIPHPEISMSTLWSKVWYEGYPVPEYAWQSSSATDDFEPKLSLMPLLFGSLKGTFYGMLFSLPLALLCAMYVSHLMDPKWRVAIKPVVELMAAIPTVVIGFLAALWLAPKLEANLLSVVFSLVVIPLFILFAMWYFIKRQRKLGAEFLLSIPFVLIGFYVAYQIGLVVQDTAFGGNINLWLYQQLGLSVDQRNCVVISFALGFAVIPIIFTISEDALYNVPKHLTAAALALGSSRWQTLRRVVLPMASPGIFAATMIGFGRAVGETMIVLMATGNTPIMSPSILNGMRTLSANIAVEIPEAPVGSSLYRLLFLSAVLLFVLTFVVNTVAELVRHQLQKKYKNL